MKILLSIKPEFIREIIDGSKKFEYRKRIFKESVDIVVIYSTKPVGKIIGEFKIKEIIKDKPENIWKNTKEFSGISKKYFDEYFLGRNEAFAIGISDFKKYDSPIDPYVIYDNFTAPQSYRYWS
ncbi:ASCH domain-containing protein [Acetobacterium paludosum]|uniref:ASCH domain-containing protein n=1 Tax=Acetobacterium paludosum TaxID=52693 RepID=A0A923KN60_9FIRM|nr:ASCH domain-containing protein [Acetobacterium paludosum]MBC3886804.1 ASCH domain-containing protein [Acetobacterium paludosum]